MVLTTTATILTARGGGILLFFRQQLAQPTMSTGGISTYVTLCITAIGAGCLLFGFLSWTFCFLE